ncbi:MAG: contractile injection system protein, VgrG/Pvc8 family [Fibromonadales bacterium]|nr:contractile injection system protein, VgrG/Pvc8 family [Fibromonadales bacterium]
MLSFNLLEGIYGDDQLSVDFLTTSGSLAKSIGKEANFSFEFEGKKEFFNGTVTGCSAEQGAGVSRAVFNVKTLRHSLDKEKKYAVYCESDAETIIRSTLSKAGVSNAKCDLSSFYEVDFKIQYNESDLAFLQRLLEDCRIIEFVKHGKDRSELVISDSGEFAGSDLNLVKCRLEMNEGGNFFFGYGHSPLRPGQAFNAFGETFIVCSAYHSGSQEAAFGLKNKNDGYTCQIAAFSKRALHSLPSSKEKPKIPGVIVARTEGFIGSFASIDSQGRYIVRMPFDEENEGMTSSLPVHLAQSFAGEDFGVHFPLRKDTPVLIAFENGDIDKPIALGAIPRDEHKGPVAGINSFQNILKTSSGIKFVLNDLTSSLDMEAPNDVSIKSEKGIKLSMDGKTGSLKMEAPKNISAHVGKTKINMKEIAPPQGTQKNAPKGKNESKGSVEMEASESISMRTGKTRLGLGDSGTNINMGAKKNVSITASEKMLLKGKRKNVLQAGKGIKITLDDSKKSLSISAPGNISIKAGGRLVLKGKVVAIN